MEEEHDCPDCDRSPCACCPDCGAYPCCCCSGCQYPEWDCQCGSGEGGSHGTTPIAPWVKRGYNNIKRRRGNLDWNKVWPEIDITFDPIVGAADFYLMEALTSKVLFDHPTKVVSLLTVEQQEELLDLLGVTNAKERKSFIAENRVRADLMLQSDPLARLNSIVSVASDHQKQLIETIDKIFVAYVHVAIAGEIRHHIAIGGNQLDNERDVAWSEWRDVHEAVGNQAILDIKELFLEFTDDAYGGPPWAAAAEILYNRLEGNLGPNEIANKKLFIDRVFSMQHNGGQLLNKVEWEQHNIKAAGIDYLQRMLDAHHEQPPDLLFLYRMASKPVQVLFEDYLAAAEEANLEVYPEFGSTKRLIEQFRAEPLYICRYCESDAKRGHTSNCNYSRHCRDLGKDKNGVIKFDQSFFKMRWDDSECGPHFHMKTYPINQFGKPNLSKSMPVTLEVDGWYRTANDQVTNIDVSFKQKIGDPWDWKKIVDIAPSKISAINVRIKIKDEEGLHLHTTGFSQNWHIPSAMKSFSLDSFHKTCVKP